MLYEEKIIETIPVGPLGLIPLKGCEELVGKVDKYLVDWRNCLLYTSPSPRDRQKSRMPSSA